MTEQVRYRIDKSLVKEAEQVCAEIGTTPTAAVSMFFAQLVRLRALPFRPSQFPALEEYGVTLEQAVKAEDASLAEIKRDRQAGRVVRFTGKIPR